MSDARPLTGGALTRSRILDAASSLLSRVGISATTTKEIARVAGCSEAALYKHFRDKEDIFLRVLRERAPRFSAALVELPDRAGTGEVADHLTEVAKAGISFYRRSFPMAASLFANPELLGSLRRKLNLTDTGPQEPSRLLARYLRLEQERGRVADTVDPASAAALLVGACFHRAFLELFFGDDAPEGALRPASTEEFISGVVHGLLHGVRPEGAPG